VDTETPAPPVDPNAPAKHTLPSGKVVEVRSHRTLLGEDGAAVIAAQTAPGSQGVVDMHNELIRRMVTEIEPGAGGAPALDGTLETVKAQRIDDWRRLYGLVAEAYLLVLGVSVVPDQEEWADPTGPTRDTSDSRSPCGDESPS
jgi:hypothetical protein